MFSHNNPYYLIPANPFRHGSIECLPKPFRNLASGTKLCLYFSRSFSRLCSTRVSPCQRREAQVWLDNLQVRPNVLCVLGLDRRVDDHVLTRNPIDRCRHFVLIAGLQRIDHPKNLGGIATGRCGVGENEADGLLRVDDENGTDGKGLSKSEISVA